MTDTGPATHLRCRIVVPRGRRARQAMTDALIFAFSLQNSHAHLENNEKQVKLTSARPDDGTLHNRGLRRADVRAN